MIFEFDLTELRHKVLLYQFLNPKYVSLFLEKSKNLVSDHAKVTTFFSPR